MTTRPAFVWDRMLCTLVNGDEPLDPQKALSFLINWRLLASHKGLWLMVLVHRLGVSQHVHRAKRLCPQDALFITWQTTDISPKNTPITVTSDQCNKLLQSHQMFTDFKKS
jgi:hypothetical protein